MLQNNGKAEWNRQMGCGVGARAQAIWMIAAGANFYMVEPQNEIWVPVTKPRFLGQAS